AVRKHALPSLVLHESTGDDDWIDGEILARTPALSLRPSRYQLATSGSTSLEPPNAPGDTWPIFLRELPALRERGRRRSWQGRGIHPGDRGDDVGRLQRLLASRGVAVTIDGVYGPATEREVRALQAQIRAAPGPLIDRGAVGRITWRLIEQIPPPPETASAPSAATAGRSRKRARAKKKAPRKKKALTKMKK